MWKREIVYMFVGLDPSTKLETLTVIKVGLEPSTKLEQSGCTKVCWHESIKQVGNVELLKGSWV